MWKLMGALEFPDISHFIFNGIHLQLFVFHSLYYAFELGFLYLLIMVDKL